MNPLLSGHHCWKPFLLATLNWTPAFAGVTNIERYASLLSFRRKPESRTTKRSGPCLDYYVLISKYGAPEFRGLIGLLWYGRKVLKE